MNGFYLSVQDWLDAGMPLNIICNCDNRDGLLQLTEKCANLIIADPPYFECKGEFDFVWKSFDEYLEFMEGQAKLYKRVLADNGTLFVYGHAKRIAYVQVIFDKYFALINNLVWNKAEIDGLFGQSGSDQLRSFPPCTERILMYSNSMEPEQFDKTGWETVKLDVVNFQTLRNYFKKFQIAIGMSISQINYTLGHRKAEHAFYWNSTQWDLPTLETYNELLTLNPNNGFELREYETLRQEYETLRRPFKNSLHLTEVLNFRFVPSQYGHETEKPEKLTRALILTCSRENDLVVIPFVGSGTECAMSVRENRRYVGFEINPKHCATATARIKKEIEAKRQQNIFSPEKSNGKSQSETIELAF